VGEQVQVTATIVAEGHDRLAVRLRVRRRGDGSPTLFAQTAAVWGTASPAAELVALYHERWELELELAVTPACTGTNDARER
jgi:hypothetical protein